MKSESKKIFRAFYTIISFLIRNVIFLRIYNFVYERSPHLFVNFLHQRIVFPNKSFVWYIRLRNKKTVKTKVYKNDLKTLEFAIDYSWYAPGLSIIENELVTFLKNDLTYVDVGANLGMRSLVALSMNIPTRMFEANSSVCDLNEERCLDNHFEKYSIFRQGISNVIGEMKFYIDETSYMSSFHLNNDQKYIDAVCVDVTTLDKNLEDIKSTNLLIKIDVEGHELFVLQGAQQTINRHKPTIIIEINEKDDNFNKIYTMLTGLNYKCFLLYSLRTNNSLLKEISNFSDAGLIASSSDFLFINDKKLVSHMTKYVI